MKKFLNYPDVDNIYDYIIHKIENKEAPIEGFNLDDTKDDILKDLPRTYFVSGNKALSD